MQHIPVISSLRVALTRTLTRRPRAGLPRTSDSGNSGSHLSCAVFRIGPEGQGGVEEQSSDRYLLCSGGSPCVTGMRNLPSYREGGQWLPLRGVYVQATRVPRPLATRYKLPTSNHYSLDWRTRHALKATLGREPIATPAPPDYLTHNPPCAACLTVRSYTPQYLCH